MVWVVSVWTCLGYAHASPLSRAAAAVTQSPPGSGAAAVPANAPSAALAPSNALRMVNGLQSTPSSAVLFQHYVRQISVHNKATPVQTEVLAMRQALSAPTHPALVLLSSSALSQNSQPGHAPTYGGLQYQPLLLVLDSPWCLLAAQPLDAPLAWFKARGNQLRIGLPSLGGNALLWVKGMEHKLAQQWKVLASPQPLENLERLRSGAVDVVLERCADVVPALAVPQLAHLRILAASKMLVLAGGAVIPTLEMAALPSLESGWVGWFAPAAMPAAQAGAWAKALQQVQELPSTQTLIHGLGYVPLRLGPAASADRVRRFVAQWARVGEWLEQVGRSIAPQWARQPTSAKSSS